MSVPLPAAAQTLKLLAGKVVNREGVPQAGATVTLQRGGARSVVVKTDASGAFRLEAPRQDRYVVSAETPAHQQGEVQLSQPSGSVRIEVQSLLPGMEFADKPDFTVAGITDWTAVGGHGSDAVLRTSEDLARDTAAIKDPARAARGHDEARESSLRSALAADPESYDANHALGAFYLHEKEDRLASRLLERAAELHGHAAADEYLAALACRGEGDLVAARTHVAAALNGNDAAEYHLLAGELDEQMGDPIAAAREEARAVALDPNAQDYFAWGSELLVHRAVWQAAEVFSRGVALHPDSAELHTGWGAALFGAAQYGEAAEQLCAASDLDPGDRGTYLLLGKLAVGSPDPSACLGERLSRFAARLPNDPEAKYYTAMLLLKQAPVAQRERALELLHAAVTLDPHFAVAYLQLGILYSAAHENAEAQSYLERAIAADPSLAEAHYRLGVLYDRGGREEQAKFEFTVHARLVKEQADAVEQQRREVKQFVVTPPGSAVQH